MKKAILAFTLLLFLAIVLYISIQYNRWVQSTEQRLQSSSQISQTDFGEWEFTSLGDGPAALVLHGLKGGFDQGMVTVHLINNPALKFIAVSRPGYLRTPLATGQSLSEQADALLGLLDNLGIEKARVIARSAGGPYALQFALRHPDRCWGVILISAVTLSAVEQPPSTVERLLSFLVDPDFGNWLMLAMLEK
jgi:pimeloyl-ACP methyl ester carboxylesterase